MVRDDVKHQVCLSDETSVVSAGNNDPIYILRKEIHDWRVSGQLTDRFERDCRLIEDETEKSSVQENRETIVKDLLDPDVLHELPSSTAIDHLTRRTCTNDFFRRLSEPRVRSAHSRSARVITVRVIFSPWLTSPGFCPVRFTGMLLPASDFLSVSQFSQNFAVIEQVVLIKKDNRNERRISAMLDSKYLKMSSGPDSCDGWQNNEFPVSSYIDPTVLERPFYVGYVCLCFLSDAERIPYPRRQNRPNDCRRLTSRRRTQHHAWQDAGIGTWSRHVRTEFEAGRNVRGDSEYAKNIALPLLKG
ncbi:hypothetical protein G5I_10523 [Acromyrmex echinatior]|uniref:Uncharacterized protein n=1 Tax=Acromyrmex echinatior TaxID=103372 RepID=F4WX32_ACREC|nr:hypothetical protein G5I_10523 [Acromyrmex echinatior]